MHKSSVIGRLVLGDLTIFVLNTSYLSSCLQQLSDQVLSDAERYLWSSFPHERKRREWMAGRLAAKFAVQETLVGQSKTDWSLRDISVMPTKGRSGPVKSPIGGYLSLSHSGAFAAAVHADRPVGLDIERFHAFSLPSLNYFLTPQEIACIETYGYCDRYLTLIWSIKEAVLKARQTSNLSEMREIECRGWSLTREISVYERGERIPNIHFGYWSKYAIATAGSNVETRSVE